MNREPSHPTDCIARAQEFLRVYLNSASRYNAVFGTALALGQENVKDTKLDDGTGLALDLDVELDHDAAGFKTQKLAHVSRQFLQLSPDDYSTPRWFAS